MRRPKTLLAMLALVALMASAGGQQSTTTYTSTPKAVKQVVKTQNRAKMLSNTQTPSRKKAPSADMFQGMTMYVNLTNSDEWSGYGIGSVPYGIYSHAIGDNSGFQALATDLRYNFMASAMGRDQLVGARPMEIFGNLNGVEYNGLSRNGFNELWSQIYESVDFSFIPSVMAYDVTSDIIYSIQYNSDLTGLNIFIMPAAGPFFHLSSLISHLSSLTITFFNEEGNSMKKLITGTLVRISGPVIRQPCGDLTGIASLCQISPCDYCNDFSGNCKKKVTEEPPFCHVFYH